MRLRLRYKKVAEGIMAGLSNKEIAAKARISENSVRHYVQRMLDIFDIHSWGVPRVRLLNALHSRRSELGIRCTCDQ